MGKFDGILLCTDLDGTLLTSDNKISHGNKRAIEYFKSEGGFFTFTTGRCISGATMLLDYIKPNAPMVCFNGGGVYDFENDKLIHLDTLDKKAEKAVKFVYDNFPYVAINIATARENFYCRSNKWLEEYKTILDLPNDMYVDYQDVTDDWVKVIFMLDADKIETLSNAFAESEFADEFEFVQSYVAYYEMLPKNTNKGSGLLNLAKILNIPRERTIGIGDNFNDISLITQAGTGIAVANAVRPVLEAADYITVDNDSDAIKAVVEALENGIITL